MYSVEYPHPHVKMFTHRQLFYENNASITWSLLLKVIWINVHTYLRKFKFAKSIPNLIFCIFCLYE